MGYLTRHVITIIPESKATQPTKQEFDEKEEYSTSGLKLIKNLTDKISYMRILNLNNTVFEIKYKGDK